MYEDSPFNAGEQYAFEVIDYEKNLANFIFAKEIEKALQCADLWLAHISPRMTKEEIDEKGKKKKIIGIDSEEYQSIETIILQGVKIMSASKATNNPSLRYALLNDALDRARKANILLKQATFECNLYSRPKMDRVKSFVTSMANR